MSHPISLTFLGTGTSQGIPVVGSKHPVCLSNDPRDKRLRVSILLQWGQTNVVVDCGPDFRQQMLTSGIDRLDAVLMTHEHNDHMAGLDDVRPFNFIQKEAIPLYGTKRTIEAVKTRFPYIFDQVNKYPGAPSIATQIINPYVPFDLMNKHITPIEAMHGNLAIIGFKIDNMAYMTDVKTLDQRAKDALSDLDLLVLSALRLEPHRMHLNLEEALNLIQELRPKRTYLTHISHLMGFHDEVTKKLPHGVYLAHDQLKIQL